jgi:hypothetical protein
VKEGFAILLSGSRVAFRGFFQRLKQPLTALLKVPPNRDFVDQRLDRIVIGYGAFRYLPLPNGANSLLKLPQVAPPSRVRNSQATHIACNLLADFSSVVATGLRLFSMCGAGQD